MSWTSLQTTTHQDHVIAHVVGATIRGYLLFDETAYLLLDIGFVWNIYLDGEMGLVPHPVTVNELEVSDEVKAELKDDIDLLLADRDGQLKQLTAVDAGEIQNVEIFEHDDLLRIVINCGHDRLVVETSVQQHEVILMSNGKDDKDLEAIADEEADFVRQQLEKQLGRAPTQEEIDEWLREHTESY